MIFFIFFSEKLKAKMILFNLQMTLVLYAKFESNKSIPLKIEKTLEQTDKDLTEKQLTLNADKSDMLFYTNHTDSGSEFTFKGEFIKLAHACQ